MAAPVIELYPHADDQPFAAMMLTLIRQNLQDRPDKLADFERMRGRVALVAQDIDAAVTLRFSGGRLSVHGGIHGIPDLVIRGESVALVDLSRVPPHPRAHGFPDLTSEPGKAIVRALRERKLRFYGLFSHLALSARLSRIMSVY
jgi:hypothetical protein